MGRTITVNPCLSVFFIPRSLDLTGPLLLGGVPDLPENFPVRMRHFVGCMRNLQVDSRHVDMADFIANNGTVPGTGDLGAGAGLGAKCREGRLGTAREHQPAWSPSQCLWFAEPRPGVR